MPTVKMSGGKVVTKSGKVSCTCCAAECCMYPWPNCTGAEVDLFYPITDLPATVQDPDGGTISLGADPAFPTYGNSDGSTWYIAADSLGSGKWVMDSPSFTAGYQADCLFGQWEQTYGDAEAVTVTDQFLAVYSFTYNAIAYTLTRQSLCYWKVSAVGHEASGPSGIYGLYYEVFAPYVKETVTAPFNLCWVLNFVDADENYFEIVKDDPQNAPDGSYASGFITISP